MMLGYRTPRRLVILFLFFFFLYCFFFIRPTEPKSGNDFEAKRKKVGMAFKKKDCSKVQLMRFHMNGHTAQFRPQIRK